MELDLTKVEDGAKVQGIDLRAYLLAKRQALLGEVGAIERVLNLKRAKARSRKKRKAEGEGN